MRSSRLAWLADVASVNQCGWKVQLFDCDALGPSIFVAAGSAIRLDLAQSALPATAPEEASNSVGIVALRIAAAARWEAASVT